MAQSAAAVPARKSLVQELDSLLQTVGEAVNLISSDPKWAPQAAMLNRSLDRGRVIVERLAHEPAASGDLGQIVDGAIGFAGGILDALSIPEIEFYRNIEPGIRLPGPPSCWERALINLLVHAGESMQRGGVVEVCAQRAGDEIEIIVADNGPGVPEGALKLLFSPHSSTRQRRAGMKLHAVEAIIRENGGSISVSNRRDSSGTAFRIAVPD